MNTTSARAKMLRRREVIAEIASAIGIISVCSGAFALLLHVAVITGGRGI